MIRENEIAFACGMKGSGKSFWLREQFVVKQPRVIHIDPNGDYIDDKNVLIVAGYDGLLTALDAFAAANQREWRVAVALDDPDDVAALFDLLAPRADFGRGSLARAFGGVAVECGECDQPCPNGRTAPEIQNGWRSGRHFQLNLYMGTQRPAACDRLLTAQADVVAIFAMDEPIDLDWAAKKFGRPARDVIAQLPDHWHVEKRRGERELSVIDPAGAVARSIAIVATGPSDQISALPGDDGASEPPRRRRKN